MGARKGQARDSKKLLIKFKPSRLGMVLTKTADGKPLQVRANRRARRHDFQL